MPPLQQHESITATTPAYFRRDTIQHAAMAGSGLLVGIVGGAILTRATNPDESAHLSLLNDKIGRDEAIITYHEKSAQIREALGVPLSAEAAAESEAIIADTSQQLTIVRHEKYDIIAENVAGCAISGGIGMLALLAISIASKRATNRQAKQKKNTQS